MRYLIYFFLFLSLATDTFAWDYRTDIFDNFQKGGFESGLGALVIAILIIGGIVFGSKQTKLIILGWFAFFLSFGFFVWVQTPINSIIELLFALIGSFVVSMIFFNTAQKIDNQEFKNRRNDFLNYQKLSLNKNKKKKRIKRKRAKKRSVK